MDVWWKNHFLCNDVWPNGITLHQPGDSSRDLFIPDRWRSRFHPVKGSRFHHSKKVTSRIARNLDFLEIAGDFPFLFATFWGKSIVFEVAILWPEMWGGPPKDTPFEKERPLQELSQVVMLNHKPSNIVDIVQWKICSQNVCLSSQAPLTQ